MHVLMLMDGWPIIETDAGGDALITTTTELFILLLPTPVITTLFISRDIGNHLATKYLKSSACTGLYTDIAVISFTYQVHRAGSVV